jgi:hypothetical protein
VAATHEPLALHPRPWPLLQRRAAVCHQGMELEASVGQSSRQCLPRPRWSAAGRAHQPSPCQMRLVWSTCHDEMTRWAETHAQPVARSSTLPTPSRSLPDSAAGSKDCGGRWWVFRTTSASLRNVLPGPGWHACPPELPFVSSALVDPGAQKATSRYQHRGLTARGEHRRPREEFVQADSARTGLIEFLLLLLSQPVSPSGPSPRPGSPDGVGVSES